MPRRRSPDPRDRPPGIMCRIRPPPPPPRVRRPAFNRAVAELAVPERAPVAPRRTATRGRPAGRGRGAARATNTVDVIVISDDDDDDEAPARRGRGRVAARRARGAARGRFRPAVSGSYIRLLLRRTHSSRDSSPESDHEPSDGSSEVSDENSEGSDIVELSDDSDNEVDAAGPIHRDVNHIRQPIFDEDQLMYQRELRLYHDDTEYRVPPAEVPTDKGKPIQPDGTWGDCTMCSNTPVKPQGCNKCLQILGCFHCVKRWHLSRNESSEGPSCPLCRNPWNVRPKTSAMKTIDARKKKLAKNGGPSTSAST